MAVLTSALQLAQGDISVFQAKEGDAAITGQALAELWGRLLGFERAQSDHLDAKGPWLTDNGTEALASIAQEGLLSLPQALQTLADASAQQLMQAREDLATFRLMQPAAEALEISFGSNAFGWGIFRDFSDDPWFLVQLLLSLLQMRKKGYDAQITIVGQALRQNERASRRQIALIEALRKEVPAIAPIFTGDRKRPEPVTPQSYERRIERLRTLRPRFQKELDAFFQRHPEFSLATEEASATSAVVETEKG